MLIIRRKLSITSMQTRYTEQELRAAVNSSISIRETLIKLSIVPAGGNYQVIKKYIKKYNINTSHFKGRAWNKGRTFKPKRPLEVYLSNDFPIHSYRLKQRLISEGVFDKVCSKCNRKTWLSKPIPLELDHVDGNSSDNSLNNLRLLCPNCHALTPTYRGKNIKS